MRLIGLSCLAWLLLTAQGSMLSLSYEPGDTRLHFRCPVVDSVNGDLLMVKVIQIPDHGLQTVLVSWVYGEEAVASNNRVTMLMKSESQMLEADLNSVSCYDDGIFMCNVTASNNFQGTFYPSDSKRMEFRGEITKPSITRNPEKTCYEAGSTLSLNCTATTGTTENRIVWEAGPQGGPFSPITRETKRAKIVSEEQREDADCMIRSHIAFDYWLIEEDDGKTFRCRLPSSDRLMDQVTVSVKKGCARAAVHTTPKTAGLTSDPVPTRKLRVKGQTAATSIKAGSEDQPVPMLLIILIVIPVAVALVLVSMAILLRQWRKKQIQPVVVIDNPSSSDYGYSARQLPDLPHLTQQEHTTPKWVSSHHGHGPASPNTSIYVSMSGLDNLRREGEESTNLNPEKAEPTADGAGHGDEELGPDMRTDRSESVYSNKEAIEIEAARAYADSVSSAHSTNVKEVA